MNTYQSYILEFHKACASQEWARALSELDLAIEACTVLEAFPELAKLRTAVASKAKVSAFTGWFSRKPKQVQS